MSELAKKLIEGEILKNLDWIDRIVEPIAKSFGGSFHVKDAATIVFRVPTENANKFMKQMFIKTGLTPGEVQSTDYGKFTSVSLTP